MAPLMILLCALFSTCLAKDSSGVSFDVHPEANIPAFQRARGLHHDGLESYLYDLPRSDRGQRVAHRNKYVRGGTSEYEPIPHDLYETDYISERMQQQRVLDEIKQQEEARSGRGRYPHPPLLKHGSLRKIYY